MRRAYRARLLTPVAEVGLRHHEDGLLVVAGDGRIEYAGSFSEAARAGALLRDLRPALLIPGFVDAHVHPPQTRIVGSATGPLLAWLESSVFPEEARLREPSYARAVASDFVQRALASGTTTSALYASSDPHATEVLFEVLEAAGLRAIVGLTLMDRGAPEALCVPLDVALAACAQLTDTWQGRDDGRLGFAVTPRFALSCTRPLLEAAGRFAAERGLLVQTHVAENEDEERATLALHPYASDYLGVYEATGLLGPRTLLAHGVHFTPSAWERVAKAGARLAHCPDSNFFLGSGRMHLAEALRRRIPVGLASDVGAGRSFDLRRAMASAYDTALCVGAPVGPDVLFELATLGGARALGLDARVGSLEPGKEADFVVLDVPPWATTREALVGHLVFAGEGVRVRSVFVRGRRVSAGPV
jgi:guanine deaminase